MIVQQYVGNFMMTLDLADNGISHVLYRQGGREAAFMGLLRETVEEGMVCLDLGANIGYTTLYMLNNVGPDGFVYAIEPGKHNLELLQQNVEQNGYEDRCEITEGAISSTDGQLDIVADTELAITAPTVDIDASTEVNISTDLKVGEIFFIHFLMLLSHSSSCPP